MLHVATLVAVGLSLAGSEVAAEERSRPDDLLTVAAVEKIIAEERSDAICVMVWGPEASTNLTQAQYEGLRKRRRRFFECDGAQRTFIVGPLLRSASGQLRLEIHRVAAHSPCRYSVTSKKGKWRLKAEPCITM